MDGWIWAAGAGGRGGRGGLEEKSALVAESPVLLELEGLEEIERGDGRRVPEHLDGH